VILVLLLTFILENTQRVDISYFGVHGTCPVPEQPRAWPSRLKRYIARELYRHLTRSMNPLVSP
jgi:hypothetical protein